MALNSENNIKLTGLDWSSRLRDVTLDTHLWNKIVQWHGNSDKALRWVQLQIKLFSARHPEHSSLSHIVSSIAFVEMANPDAARAAEQAHESCEGALQNGIFLKSWPTTEGHSERSNSP